MYEYVCMYRDAAELRTAAHTCIARVHRQSHVAAETAPLCALGYKLGRLGIDIPLGGGRSRRSSAPTAQSSAE